METVQPMETVRLMAIVRLMVIVQRMVIVLRLEIAPPMVIAVGQHRVKRDGLMVSLHAVKMQMAIPVLDHDQLDAGEISQVAVRAVVNGIDNRFKMPCTVSRRSLGHGFDAPRLNLRPQILGLLTLGFAATSPIALATGNTLISLNGMERPVALAPAGVHVISADDIIRSGLTRLPDLLRLAPGVEVIAVSDSAWRIALRGTGADALQRVAIVLDGRVIAGSPTQGVYWDAWLPLPEDIEQIEVVSGPMVGVWGSAQTGGLIHIRTRAVGVAETGRVVAGIGSAESWHFGGSTPYHMSNGHARHYFHVFNQTAEPIGEAPSGQIWRGWQSGGRGDWHTEGDIDITLQWDAAVIRNTWVTPESVSLSLSPVAERRISALAKVVQFFDQDRYLFQASYDWQDRQDAAFNRVSDFLRLGYQYDIRPAEPHQVSFGLQYAGGEDRWSEAELPSAVLSQRGRDHFQIWAQHLWSMHPAFDVQWQLAAQQIRGFEAEPAGAIRGVWHKESWAIWAGLSQAVRFPGLAETALTASRAVTPDQLAAVSEWSTLGVQQLRYQARTDLQPERLSAAEIGGRWHDAAEQAWMELVLFGQEYRDFLALGWEANAGIAAEPILTHRNLAELARTGVEWSAGYSISPAFQLSGGYSYGDSNDLDEPERSTVLAIPGESCARQQARIEMRWMPTPSLQFWVAARYRDYPSAAVLSPESWVDVTVRLQPWRDWWVSLTGQNLGAGVYRELIDPWSDVPATELRGRVSLELRWEQR
jgi:iron complex outermembrane receptor protein